MTKGKISARLHFIELLVYYNHDRIPVSTVRDWYAAVLKAIELGRAKWGNDPLVYGQPIL